MTDKKTAANRDANLRYLEPTHTTVSTKKLSETKAVVKKSGVVKPDKKVMQIILSRKNIEAGLNKKVADVFAKAFKAKKLLTAKELIAKGYKMENLAGVKNIKLSSMLDKQGRIKKEGDILINYIHSFVSEGFSILIGKHPRSTAKTEKLAVYLKK